MQSQAPHRASDKTVVAESPILTIEACGCGVMHLHFGPVSMRFTQGGLEDIHRSITEALIRVQAPAPSTSDTVTPLFMAGGPARGQA
ncbi:MAG: hypothetical protein ACRBN8_02540 [Nannocystales bacterium]